MRARVYRLLRRTIKPAVVAFLDSRFVRAVAGGLFRFGATRTLLNAAYDRIGPRFIGGRLDRILSRGGARNEFLWRSRMGGRTVILPVSPSLPGSWTAARTWSMPATAPIRTFYECQLQHASGGIFFDVGANYGIHSYPFAAQGYRCVAFEPQPLCVEYMRRVGALNDFREFTMEQCAVGEDKADVEFFVSDGTWFSSFDRALVERFQLARSTRVNSVSLDTYCRSSRSALTVMKVDVEGWEWQVLMGGAGIIEHTRPSIVVEVFSWAPHKARLWAWFRSLGYLAFAARERSVPPLRPIDRKEEFLEATESDFIFLADRELAERVALLT